jgi:hypothetical protein
MSAILSPTAHPAMSPMGNQALPPGAINGPAAWYGPTMDKQRDWLIALNDTELAEIEQAVQEHRRAGREMGDISSSTFKLPTLGKKLLNIQPRLCAVAWF